MNNIKNIIRGSSYLVFLNKGFWKKLLGKEGGRRGLKHGYKIKIKL